MNIEYVENTQLVRGLDYYTHTVFEVEADIKGFGSQNVLGAGGRYNNLVETVGGPATCGVGFAIGLERFLLALEAEKIEITEEEDLDVYIFAMDEAQKPYVISIANTLRLNGFNVDVDYVSRNLKNNFKHADRLKTKFVIIIGDEEVSSKILTVKNNQTKEEYKIKLEELIHFLDSKIGDE